MPTTTPRPLASTRLHVQDCTDCDGRGRFYEEDGDSEDPRVALSVCEGCAGSGLVGSCRRCLDVAPLPELEDRSGHCVSCAVEMETGDAVAEMRRIGAWRQ